MNSLEEERFTCTDAISINDRLDQFISSQKVGSHSSVIAFNVQILLQAFIVFSCLVLMSTVDVQSPLNRIGFKSSLDFTKRFKIVFINITA